MEKFNVVELFSGIGAQHKALELIKKEDDNFEYEIVATADWDLFANISYATVHNNDELLEEINLYESELELEFEERERERERESDREPRWNSWF